MRMRVRSLTLPVVLAVAAMIAVPAQAQTGQKAREASSVRPAVYTPPSHVSYEPDGTPIATGAPRRLSILAGNDGRAWSYVHTRTGRAKHKAVRAPH